MGIPCYYYRWFFECYRLQPSQHSSMDGNNKGKVCARSQNALRKKIKLYGQLPINAAFVLICFNLTTGLPSIKYHWCLNWVKSNGHVTVLFFEKKVRCARRLSNKLISSKLCLNTYTHLCLHMPCILICMMTVYHPIWP